ncbi:MAG: CvpA family protein [Caulobacteraceae bacterium]|nr:CvpA family protein [Caulobacteraceae bacterium]MBK8544241.1 CvpA family protein [Caulobacteraceae bacterium]MBP6688500.1 CvpA family protein [Hyphomonadaceae bacterium]
MDLGFTWFDFAALAIVGLSAVMAFARGLIREVFSIIAFIAGLLGALVGFFTSITRPVVESFTPLSGFIADLAGGLLIFLIIFIVITVVTSSVAKQFHQSTEIGSFDRAAGLAFGILRGIVFVAVFFVLPIRILMPEDQNREPSFYEDGVVGARTYPIYSGVASALQVLLPKARDRARDIIDRREGESAPIPPAEPATTQAQP